MQTRHNSAEILPPISSMILSCGNDRLKKLWNGSDGTPGLRERIREEGADPDKPVTNRLRCWETIVSAMDSYLCAYPAPPSCKQPIWELMVDCLREIQNRYGLAPEEDPEELLVRPVTRDTTVELLKALHNRDGISKRELSEKLGVSGRQVQGYLASLSPARDQTVQKAPLRFGGQLVQVQVEEETLPGNAGKKYVTKDTLHPVALQLNMMQAGVLLESLHKNHEEGSLVSYGLALDVWAQLSDYAKDRIWTIFGPKSMEFQEFLDALEDDLTDASVSVFQTESEMLEEGNVSLKEEVMLALKGGYACDLWLSVRGQRRELTNQRIIMLNKGYAAFPAEKRYNLQIVQNEAPGDVFPFDINKVVRIERHE